MFSKFSKRNNGYYNNNQSFNNVANNSPCMYNNMQEESKLYNTYDYQRIESEINETRRNIQEIKKRITQIENYLGINEESVKGNYNTN